MRYHTSRVEQEIVCLRNLQANLKRGAATEQTETNIEAAEPINEDGSGNEPGKQEAERAINKLPSQDGEGSLTP